MRERLIDANSINFKPILVSREQGKYEELFVAYKDDIDAIPTDSRSKQGYWNLKAIRGYWRNVCSVCEKETGTMYCYPFCPHCGAQMIDVIDVQVGDEKEE